MKDQGVETERAGGSRDRGGTGKEGNRERGGTRKEGEQGKRKNRKRGKQGKWGTVMGTERVRAGKAWEQVSSRDGDRVGTVPTWSDVSIPAGGHGTVLWS